MEELLKNSDYVSMYCSLTESTKHMINKDTLSLMKPSAFIINTSRGALIDEDALIEALENGTIAGAGLDVQETTATSYFRRFHTCRRTRKPD